MNTSCIEATSRQAIKDCKTDSDSAFPGAGPVVHSACGDVWPGIRADTILSHRY